MTKLSIIVIKLIKFFKNKNIIKNNNYINYFDILLKKKNFKNYFFLKNENFILFDINIVDLNFKLYNKIKNKNIFLLFFKKNIFINYIFNIKYNFFSLNIFLNSKFLKREMNEFFQIYFYNSIDNRNLLCDYNIKQYFLKKKNNNISIKNNINKNFLSKINIFKNKI